MLKYCPKCNSELQLVKDTGEYYCSACQVYPFITPESIPKEPQAEGVPYVQPSESWVSCGWNKGLGYYNIYFDSLGFYAARLDLVGAGRVIFGGGGMGKAYSRDKRILVQGKVADMSLNQVLGAYPIDFKAAYTEIEYVKFHGLLTKKLEIKTAEEKYVFKKGYPKEDTLAILNSIPYLEGKLVL